MYSTKTCSERLVGSDSEPVRVAKKKKKNKTTVVESAATTEQEAKVFNDVSKRTNLSRSISNHMFRHF